MLADVQARRGRGRPAVPAVPRLGGQLHGRRQHRDQRRRHRGAALRDDAQPRARARGGAARRAGVGRAAVAAQGQHRLRPDPALHRRRGHPRHRHRRRAHAAPGDARAAPPRGSRCPTSRPRPRCSRCCGSTPPSGSRPGSWSSRPALDLVLAHGPAHATRFASDADWFGLIELAGPARRDRRRRRWRRRSARPSRPAWCSMPRSPASPAQRAGLWALRERVSEAQEPLRAEPQARRVGADHVAAALRRARPAARSEGALPGDPAVIYGHVGDGNLHYNLSRPVGPPTTTSWPTRAALSRDRPRPVAALGGSISAEHGIGLAKAAAARRTRATSRSTLMRAVKHALDPRRTDEPGQGPAPEGESHELSGRTVARLALGAAMVGAGVLHLTTQREEFPAQVPDWFPLDDDLTVLASGVVEIGLGAAFVALPSNDGSSAGCSRRSSWRSSRATSRSTSRAPTPSVSTPTRAADPAVLPARAGALGPVRRRLAAAYRPPTDRRVSHRTRGRVAHVGVAAPHL